MAKISGTFTGTGTSAVLQARIADVSISGGASATVAIQRRLTGQSSWVTMESITGNGERVVENGNSFELRLECTAFTSGTVSYTLEGY